MFLKKSWAFIIQKSIYLKKKIINVFVYSLPTRGSFTITRNMSTVARLYIIITSKTTFKGTVWIHRQVTHFMTDNIKKKLKTFQYKCTTKNASISISLLIETIHIRTKQKLKLSSYNLVVSSLFTIKCILQCDFLILIDAMWLSLFIWFLANYTIIPHRTQRQMISQSQENSLSSSNLILFWKFCKKQFQRKRIQRVKRNQSMNSQRLVSCFHLLFMNGQF